MAMKRIWYPLALLALLFGSFSWAQENPISVNLEIFIVSMVTRDDGTREERFEPATQARPGFTVEYRLTVKNVSNITQPSGVVRILGPVPTGTTFVPFSASASSETLLTEFAADAGVAFAETNVVRVVDGERVIADPKEYTFVRWTILEELEPGFERLLRYRVIVTP
jgi:uncharacterized repeat protein (TIGR01451 family)